jgi:pyruvate kinase
MSRSVEVIEELLRAGMNVARFNFSHGSHEYHQVRVGAVLRPGQRNLGALQ